MTIDNFRRVLAQKDYNGKEIQLFVDLAVSLANKNHLQAENYLSEIRDLINKGYGYNAIRNILK